jgi:repressor LexA
MNRDPEYLDKLRDYYAQHRILPSLSGIGAMVGIKAKSAVSVMVGRLEDAGYLGYAPDRRVQPGPRFFEREIADTIRAGSPESAHDVLREAVSIDADLIDTPSKTLLLQVKGDSMVEAGIMDGDTVVVEKGAPAKSGDVVVAVVDSEYTVKYLAKDKHGFYLKPGNKGYSIIRPENHLEVFGLVTGCYRKY